MLPVVFANTVNVRESSELKSISGCETLDDSVYSAELDELVDVGTTSLDDVFVVTVEVRVLDVEVVTGVWLTAGVLVLDVGVVTDVWLERLEVGRFEDVCCEDIAELVEVIVAPVEELEGLRLVLRRELVEREDSVVYTFVDEDGPPELLLVLTWVDGMR